MAEPSSEKDTAPKRRRDPERTREAILEVAAKLLASDGREGLSVSKVAQSAGINRGTAYHHFQTREQLLIATVEWVSEKLCNEVFGPKQEDGQRSIQLEPHELINNLANFVMESPDLGRVWLAKMLRTSQPERDLFWCEYKAHIARFVRADLAEPDIDEEVHGVLMLVGAILWPVWTRSGSRSVAERKKNTKRYINEVVRHSLHGVLRNEKFPSLKPGADSDT